MKTILWDFNGTLLDDNRIWQASMEEVFKAHGKTPPTVREYFLEMEGDWEKVYTGRGIEASAEKLNSIYIPYYTSRLHESELFSHVYDTLIELQNRGVQMGLITGQPEELVLPLLEKFNIKKFFDKKLIYYHIRNKSKVIGEVLEILCTNHSECWYIGDSPSDIAHAQKAGINTVAYLSEFIPGDLVLAKNPTHTISTIKELLNLFK